MARVLDGVDQYLKILTPGFLDGLSAATVVIRFKTTSSAQQCLLHYYKDTGDAFILNVNQPTLKLFTYIEHNDDKETLAYDLEITDGVMHCVAVTMSTVAGNHRLFFDGVQRDYIAADDQCFSTMDAGADLHVGVNVWGGSPTSFMNGSVAELIIYNTVLTVDELIALDKGVSPFLVRPQNLAHYWPLVRDDNARVGGYNLTPYNSPTFGPHCPVIYPTGPQVSAAVNDVTVEPTTFELALTLETPSVAFDCTVTPPTFELALTQHAPSLVIDSTVTPDTFALALTQYAPDVSSAVIITPATFELALTQHTPSLAFDYTITPDTFELALTLHAPTIVIPSDVTVLPDTFELALALLAPEIIVRFVDIPPFMVKDLIDPYSGGAWLWLVVITVPTQTTQRIARNTEDIIYGGINFPKGNFDIGKQSFSGDGSIPRIVLRVAQDRDHTLEDIVNATKGGANGQVKLIRTCEKFLETPVAELEADYDILNAGSDVQWVTFSLGIPNPLTQRIPLWLYSSKVCPLATPSLFKGPKCQYAGGDSVCTGLFEDCYTKGNAVHWGAEIGLDPNAVRV